MTMTTAPRGGRLKSAPRKKFPRKLDDDVAKTLIVTVTASKAREEFSTWMSTVSYGHKWLVLKRHGKALVAMVPMADLQILRDLEDKVDLKAARAALAEPGEIPWEAVKEKLGI